ncbi:TraV family lipoprotein (plasmid) [Bermanella marisrubri]|nr:TraV family lipoprotein [Bermanella marisrubri]QIZ85909.1 TraV family lipoprotein [Bermanella marisrubri]
MNRFLIVFFLIAAVGCSDKYSCNGYPDMPCASISGVYDRTKDGVRDYRSASNYDEEGNWISEEDKPSVSPNNITVSDTYNALNYVSVGDPILSEPRILRGLLFPWEDSEKDLQAGGYIYLRVEEPKWIMVE